MKKTKRYMKLLVLSLLAVFISASLMSLINSIKGEEIGKYDLPTADIRIRSIDNYEDGVFYIPGELEAVLRVEDMDAGIASVSYTVETDGLVWSYYYPVEEMEEPDSSEYIRYVTGDFREWDLLWDSQGRVVSMSRCIRICPEERATVLLSFTNRNGEGYSYKQTIETISTGQQILEESGQDVLEESDVQEEIHEQEELYEQETDEPDLEYEQEMTEPPEPETLVETDYFSVQEQKFLPESDEEFLDEEEEQDTELLDEAADPETEYLYEETDPDEELLYEEETPAAEVLIEAEVDPRMDAEEAPEETQETDEGESLVQDQDTGDEAWQEPESDQQLEETAETKPELETEQEPESEQEPEPEPESEPDTDPDPLQEPTSDPEPEPATDPEPETEQPEPIPETEPQVPVTQSYEAPVYYYPQYSGSPVPSYRNTYTPPAASYPSIPSYSPSQTGRSASGTEDADTAGNRDTSVPGYRTGYEPEAGASEEEDLEETRQEEKKDPGETPDDADKPADEKKEEKKAEEKVNTEGSTYDISGIEDLIGQCLQEVPDLVIYENNADTVDLETVKVLAARNGETFELEKEADYTVKLTGLSEELKTYKYVIDRGVFEEEGSYRVFLFSEDASGNSNSSEGKDTPIWFTIDVSSPLILSCDDTSEQQQQNIREVRVKDNTGLSAVDIYLGDRKMDYETEGETYRFRVPEDVEQSDVKVVARDEAGNTYERILPGYVTAGKPKMRSANAVPVIMIAAAAAAAAMAMILIRKRKKNRNRN